MPAKLAGHRSDRMMVPIQLYPFFDPLRGDPRYAELLRKMKLTPTARVRRASQAVEPV